MDAEDDDDEAIFSFAGATFWLAVATVLIAFLSESLTDAIEGAAASLSLPDSFIGFVLIPIVGNAAEHATAVVMAYRRKMNLALGVALGSSTQISLFVIPVMVILGWIMDRPMGLQFGVFEVSMAFISSVIVAFVVADGQTNWLQGAMLVASYIIVSTAFYFYKRF